MSSALIYFFGYSPHLAQGTTLALLVPPVGLLAAFTYYQNGHVNLRTAIIICLGFILGSLVGAKYALSLPDHLLTKIFGVFLLLLSLKMLTQ